MLFAEFKLRLFFARLLCDRDDTEKDDSLPKCRGMQDCV